MPKKKTAAKKLGRPRKIVGGKLSHAEVAKELVEGIVVIDEGREMRRVPTLREVAKRFGVWHSLIGKIAQAEDCLRKHELYRQAHPEPFDAYDEWEARKKAKARPKAALRPEPEAAPEPIGGAPGLRKRKPGHPSRLDCPVPWNEIDRLLVVGENIELPDGTQSTHYPPLRELGRRFGVSHSAIVKYWQDHHCERRRETARQRLIDKTEEKLIELRATAIAVSKDDALRIIDKFLVKFEQALDDDRVRYDLPADFSTMVRLKEFVSGGPDSRQETTTTFTLEMLQERHQRMLRDTRELSPAEMGVVDASGHEVTPALETSEVDSEVDSDDTLDRDAGEAEADAASLYPPDRPFEDDAGQQTDGAPALADEEET
jgi:transcriptional regulator with XRE-family HTH domain